jgi:hypothetical protein
MTFSSGVCCEKAGSEADTINAAVIMRMLFFMFYSVI